jgi:hypothetical protein
VTWQAAIRQNSGHALLNAAFRVKQDGEGTIAEATLVYGLAQDRAVCVPVVELSLRVHPPAVCCVLCAACCIRRSA